MPGSSASAASGRDGSIGCHSRHGGSWSRSRASASQQARVLPVEDPPTSTAIPLRPSAAARTTWPSTSIVLARHIRRQHRQPRRRVLGLHRPVHLQGERVGHLLQRPPRHRYAAVRPGQRVPDLSGQPGEHSLDPLSLQARQLMVELVGQRRQRPAARSADDDLPHQVTGQPVRQDSARHSQDIGRGLPGAGQPGIIEHSQLSGYPRLQAFQQHHRPGQRRIWHRITEDLADHHRDLPGLLATRWAHLLGGGPDCGVGRPPQRTLLLTAEYQLGQLLAASVGKLPDEPPPKSVSNEHHASSLPATVQLSGIPASAVVTGHLPGPATTRRVHPDTRKISPQPKPEHFAAFGEQDRTGKMAPRGLPSKGKVKRITHLHHEDDHGRVRCAPR